MSVNSKIQYCAVMQGPFIKGVLKKKNLYDPKILDHDVYKRVKKIF